MAKWGLLQAKRTASGLFESDFGSYKARGPAFSGPFFSTNFREPKTWNSLRQISGLYGEYRSNF